MNRPSSQFTMYWFISTVWILFTFTHVAARSVLRDRQGPDVIKVFVTEGDDVILPCSPRPNVNIEATVFDWKRNNKEVFMFTKDKFFGNSRADQDQDFKGRVSHFDEELKHGNASILLRDTRITDSGNYTCIFPHLVPEQTCRIELVVGPDVIKVFVTEGDDVILPCSPRPNVSIEATVFDWKRNNKEVFMFTKDKFFGNSRADQDQDFKGRVSHFDEELKHGNASILLRDTRITDSGNYTCIFPHLVPEQTCRIELVVGPDVIKVFVTEGDDVILPCSPRPNVSIEATVFDWKRNNKEVFLFDNSSYFGNGRADQDQDFKGRVSHFAEELKHGNASILLRDTRTTDSGNYTCIFPHLVPEQRYRIDLVVGAATTPYVKIRNITGDWVLLECFVRDAYPEPQVEWQTSDGNVVPAEEPQVSPRGHRFDVLLLTTVKKTTTNMYRCELLVPDNLFEDKSSTSSSWLIVIITIIVTLVIEHLGGFLVKVIMNWGRNAKQKGSPTEVLPLNGHQLSNGS
ncbi:CD276 antigen-like isoform X2 [Platichthys flesus]|uniref:CD276 antigen-like isoform X2 n=1 Tax=Platichthys flesus TaxID=8260 RepID=UPI002DB62608|nr:CD276 antigen-like isoform X2 [Platichthys flesus]